MKVSEKQKSLASTSSTNAQYQPMTKTTASSSKSRSTSSSLPASTFGPLPSWFPQPQSHGPSAGGDSIYSSFSEGVDGVGRSRPESYPLFNDTLHQQYSMPESSSMRSYSKSTNENGKKIKRKVVQSPPSIEDDELNEKDDVKKKGKKRRRVVVACDVCRRKKVKCEGLPNTTNTCDNCQNFGYTCTFTVEPDRSRGRYEILEAQKDTILGALRIVAPHLAEQFDRGELSASSLSGLRAERSQTFYEDSKNSSERPGTSQSTNERLSGNLAADESDTLDVSRDSKRDLGPMIPDLEEGRPRYFGGSSNLTSFHHLDSRPSSPRSSQRYKYLSNNDNSSEMNIVSGFQTSSLRNGPNDARSKLMILPRPRPQYPSNSVGWVRHVRRKTLVAVGRDDLYAAEGWFQRHPFPEASLLHELLDFYFLQLHPLLPIIHEHSLRKDLSQGRAEKDSAFRGLIFTIIAISSRFFRDDRRVREDPSDPDTAGDQFSAASRFHHQVYAASIINVQVLLLATAFMPSTLSSGPSFVVLGAAIRASQDIGLHTERAYGEYSPLEQEMRRRAFWAAFILDSIISINMGRPTALRLEDISVKFPLLASEESLTRAEAGGNIEEMSPLDKRPCPAAGFIHLIKLNIIAQDVVNHLYSPRRRVDFASSYTPQGMSITSQQRNNASYKDMTVLCKRLDEWVAEMPSHLQDIKLSPYKLQAGLLQCGRHDVRLYILKPFLQDQQLALPSQDVNMRPKSASLVPPSQDGSILKKMLLPQCANHARECIKTLSILCDEGQLSHMVFIMQQAFLSAATFMLTVWHGTKDIATLYQDRDLIEATLLMLRPEENKYCSALLRRAQRILCNIAQRAMAGINDATQRQRMQYLIDLHGLLPVEESSKLFASTDNLPGGNTAGNRSGIIGTREVAIPSIKANGMPIAVESHVKSDQYKSSNQTGGLSITPSNSYPALTADYLNPSINIDSKVNSPIGSISNGNANPMTINNEMTAIEQWIPLDSSYVTTLQQNEPGGIEITNSGTGGLEFTSDLAWTDYFSRFLGGLPSPLAANSTMSPMNTSNNTP